MGESRKKDFQKMLDHMMNICSRREYSRADAATKIRAMSDVDDEEVERMLGILIEQKYIDDFRYAAAFARDKASIAGWGVNKIRYMLSAKGISREIIAQALAEIDPAKAGGRLDKLMENKAHSLAGDPQIRMKLLRFGLGRGYSYDEVSSVVEQLLR